MSEIPMSRREMSAQLRRRLERATANVRRSFQVKAVDSESEKTAIKRREKEWSIKGRITADGSERWDIFELRSRGRPVLVTGNIAFREEAIAIARDLVLGRTSVSFGGVRTCFAGGMSGIVTPDASVDRSGRGIVHVRDGASPRSVIVSRTGANDANTIRCRSHRVPSGA